MQSRDKRSPRLNLPPSPSLPCTRRRQHPRPSGPFLLSCACWKNSEPAPRTGCQQHMCSQELPGPFPSLHPRTGKGQSVPPGEPGYSGLCDGPAGGWQGALASSAPSHSRQGGPVPTRLPPGTRQGRFCPFYRRRHQGPENEPRCPRWLGKVRNGGHGPLLESPS